MSYSLYCLMECVILLLNQICIFAENSNIINMCSTNGCCHDHSRERPEECCHGVKIDRFLNKCLTILVILAIGIVRTNLVLVMDVL